MNLPIILGFLFGFLLGLAAALLLTALAVHHEKVKYKAICRDIELWKSIMEGTAPKKHSPKPESPYLWEQRWPYKSQRIGEQRWPYKENNHEPSQPPL